MAITIEKNIAIRNAIRNDLRYIVPGVPSRYFYKRGAWRPRGTSGIEYIPGYKETGVPIEEEKAEEIKTLKAVINFSTSGNHTIIDSVTGRKIKIWFITFTVGGETNITLLQGSSAISGPMDFGGTSEPRGIVMPPDGKCIELDYNKSFVIYSSASVQVSGIVIYTIEK
jgi:hypothetical protein